MLALVVAVFASADWVPPDRPGLVARIGSPAFRHPGTGGASWSLLSVSPDGKRFYSGVYSGVRNSLSRVYVWDAQSGKVLNSYDPRHGADRISGVYFAPDGLRVIIDVRDESIPFDGKHRFRILNPLDSPERNPPRVIHVWDYCQFRLVDPDTGRILKQGKPWTALPTDSEGGFDEWASPDWFVTWREKEVVVADPQTGKTVSFTPPVKRGKAWVQEVGPDGLSAFVMEDNKCRLYDLPSGRLRSEWEDEWAWRHFYTPDGKAFAVWEKQKETWALKLRRVSDLSAETVLTNQKDRSWIAFAPDGKTFAREMPRDKTAFCDHEVRETATGKLLGTIPGLGGLPEFSPGGKIAWARYGTQLIVPWDVRAGRIRDGGPDLPGPVTAFQFLGETKLIGLSGGSVVTWDAATGKQLSRVAERGRGAWWSGGKFGPAGDRVLYVEDSFVWWDIGTRAERRIALDPKRSEKDWYIEVTPDWRLCMTWGSGTFTVRDTATGKAIYDRPQASPNPPPDSPWGRGPQPQFASSPDRKRLAVYERGDFLSGFAIFDLTNRKAEPLVLPPESDVKEMAFSPDGRFLATVAGHWGSGDYPNQVTIWSATTGRVLKHIAIPGVHPQGVSYSPDGRLLALAFDGRVVLVDTEQAKVAADFRTAARMDSRRWNRFGQQAPAWSPSGRFLAVETPDERLTIWNVAKLTAK